MIRLSVNYFFKKLLNNIIFILINRPVQTIYIINIRF